MGDLCEFPGKSSVPPVPCSQGSAQKELVAAWILQKTSLHSRSPPYGVLLILIALAGLPCASLIWSLSNASQNSNAGQIGITAALQRLSEPSMQPMPSCRKAS